MVDFSSVIEAAHPEIDTGSDQSTPSPSVGIGSGPSTARFDVEVAPSLDEILARWATEHCEDLVLHSAAVIKVSSPAPKVAADTDKSGPWTIPNTLQCRSEQMTKHTVSDVSRGGYVCLSR